MCCGIVFHLNRHSELNAQNRMNENQREQFHITTTTTRGKNNHIQIYSWCHVNNTHIFLYASFPIHFTLCSRTLKSKVFKSSCNAIDLSICFVFCANISPTLNALDACGGWFRCLWTLTQLKRTFFYVWMFVRVFVCMLTWLVAAAFSRSFSLSLLFLFCFWYKFRKKGAIQFNWRVYLYSTQ